MILAYGGGLTLSLYPISNPLDIIQKTFNDDPRYTSEKDDDSIKIKYSSEFIQSFIGEWKTRLTGPELTNFEEILGCLCFESRLYENGYFDAILSIDPVIQETVNAEILGNERIKIGFFDELGTHFKDLYECVYKVIHTHTYIRYYEAFCHLIAIEDKKDIGDAKEKVFDHFSIVIENKIRNTMDDMDDFESQIRNRNFLEFLRYDVSQYIKYSEYISNKVIELRMTVWVLNYMEMCIDVQNSSGKSMKKFTGASGFAKLVILRKEVVESIKNSIAYHMSLASTLLAFYGILLAVMLSVKIQSMSVGSNIASILNATRIIFGGLILGLILTAVLYMAYKSITKECELHKSVKVFS